MRVLRGKRRGAQQFGLVVTSCTVKLALRLTRVAELPAMQTRMHATYLTCACVLVFMMMHPAPACLSLSVCCVVCVLQLLTWA